MPKFSEDILNSWRMPPSDTEETKLSNAQRMVREAIDADPKLSKMTIEVFGQGSYANDTNVKNNSDIDINVRYMDAHYYDLPVGKNETDFSITNSHPYFFSHFKKDVEQALINKFGRSSVTRNDKCITIEANTYRVEADVVPTFLYRYYYNTNSFVEGARFFSDSNNSITNYPLQHIENGKSKNSFTQKRFKRLTRIFRRTRYRMIDDGVNVSDTITSFLLECLVWNVPNNIFNTYYTWTDRLKYSIIYLYEQTQEQDTCNDWAEVSDQLYLLRGGRKWSREDVNTFLVQMWNYHEFNK